jgi:hypothetical protein
MKRTIAGILFSVIAAKAAPPDWTGFYALARGKDLGSFKPLNLNLHEVIVAHLQPWARAKMETTDGVADDPGGTCQPDGIFRYPTFAGSFLWLPFADKILIVYNEINTAGVERVYLNRQHPRNLLPTWNGDSIGHWEGDTLVVDTIGFNDKSWLQPGMEPHSEEAHLIQRIRQIGDGAFIEITTIGGSAGADFGLYLQPLLHEDQRVDGRKCLRGRSANLEGLSTKGSPTSPRTVPRGSVGSTSR